MTWVHHRSLEVEGIPGKYAKPVTSILKEAAEEINK